jgi:hypothetical protein
MPYASTALALFRLIFFCRARDRKVAYLVAVVALILFEGAPGGRVIPHGASVTRFWKIVWAYLTLD